MGLGSCNSCVVIHKPNVKTPNSRTKNKVQK